MHNSRKSEKRGRGVERERFVRGVRERDLLKMRERDLLNKRSTLLQQFLSTTRRGKKGWSNKKGCIDVHSFKLMNLIENAGRKSSPFLLRSHAPFYLAVDRCVRRDGRAGGQIRFLNWKRSRHGRVVKGEERRSLSNLSELAYLSARPLQSPSGPVIELFLNSHKNRAKITEGEKGVPARYPPINFLERLYEIPYPSLSLSFLRSSSSSSSSLRTYSAEWFFNWRGFSIIRDIRRIFPFLFPRDECERDFIRQDG